MSKSKVETYLINNLSNIPNLNINVINDFLDIVRPLITNHTDLLKVDKWYKERNINFKSNPIKYLNDYFVQDLKNGVFDRKMKHCGVRELFNDFNEKGIEIKPNADIYLSTMFDFFYNEGYLNEKEIIECNKRAIKKLANQGKSTDDYIELFKKSKVSQSRGIDWIALEKEVEANKKEWEAILKKLEIKDERTINHIKQFR